MLGLVSDGGCARRFGIGIGNFEKRARNAFCESTCEIACGKQHGQHQTESTHKHRRHRRHRAHHTRERVGGPKGGDGITPAERSVARRVSFIVGPCRCR